METLAELPFMGDQVVCLSHDQAAFGPPCPFGDGLKHWIDYELENLVRIRNGLPTLWVPHDYETNTTAFTGWTQQGGPFREDLLKRAQNRAKELLGRLATHHYRNDDIVNAAICAMALRQLAPHGYAAPSGPDDPGSPHSLILHGKLNELFGMQPPQYAFQACDSLLEMPTHELARHGIRDSSSPATEASLRSPPA